ncbi:MAG: hypothetical protein ABIY55_22595, partial [Kofleriaceae bacterium]
MSSAATAICSAVVRLGCEICLGGAAGRAVAYRVRGPYFRRSFAQSGGSNRAEGRSASACPRLASANGMLRILLACLTAPLLLVGCGNDLGAGANTSASSGLPCDVQAVLADRCLSCHGSQLSGGAPVHLATYADLTQKNASGVTLAERALIRMTSASSLMPPPPASAATST